MKFPGAISELRFPDWSALLSRGSFPIEILGPSNLLTFLLLSGVHNPIFPHPLSFIYPNISRFFHNAVTSS